MDKKEYTEEMVRLIIEGAIQEEREACAQLLLSTDLSGLSPNYALQNFIASLLANYVAVIRARGRSEDS